MRNLCWQFAFLVLIFLLPLSVSAQSAKPYAAVAPLGALGEVDDVEKRILFNRLQSDLSNTYKLVSQQEYTQVFGKFRLKRTIYFRGTHAG